MIVQFESELFRTPNPVEVAAFWGALLDRTPIPDGDELLLPGHDAQIGLRFSTGAAHGDMMNPRHLHLSQTDRNQRDTIAACLDAGGRLRGNGHVPPRSFAAMADPGGDEFCVIEDDNGYLAGCGPLGEVSCEGTRAVGIFWSEALGWPLVWEEGEETAIQASAGGTKLAWSGDPADPARDHTRQRFILEVDAAAVDAELERLTELGATDLRRGATALRLRDPDGVDFDIRPTVGT